MSEALCIALFLPLVGFLIQWMGWKHWSRQISSWMACLSIFFSFLFFLFLFSRHIQAMEDLNVVLFDWIPVEGIHADFKLHLDSLSLLMSLIITGVGFLIHVYSVGYMKHEEDYVRYFACLNFFIFAMLLLVLAGNLLLLFVGWEGVGLASYLLIGYDYYRKKAAQAATKAFILNRIGDFGLLLGILLTLYTFGTADMEEIIRGSSAFAVGAPVITAITLLYFVGACGKSAQIPLHVWLADAMEGPTPVSALIHAATMVTAGVYLVVRMDNLFNLAPLVLQIIGTVGALTALLAALAAIGQTELKRVLAYSTVSQLGFMFVACGAQAYYAAMFHLTMHAFMKALLFLSAGNVLHALHGTSEMAQMGGLAKSLSHTNGLFLIGVLAMSGIPPLAAFFSKDLILEYEHLIGYNALFYIVLVASLLTAFYLMRAYCLTFHGEPQWKKTATTSLHGSPKVMLIPCYILAFLSIVGGFIGFAPDATPMLVNFLAEIGISPLERELSSHFHLSSTMVEAVLGGLLAFILAAFLYTKTRFRSEEPHFRVLLKAFYFDQIYDFLFFKPYRALSLMISYILEPRFFESMLIKISQKVKQGSNLLQKIQSGQIRSYASWMAIGAAFLAIYCLK